MIQISEQRPKFFTATELASALRVQPQTVYRWARRGVIPVVRAGRTTRFDFQEVLRALNQRKED